MSRDSRTDLCVAAAAQLSDEVKVLLDKIFKVNEKERISIEGIEADPWYQGPLQPKFAQAEARINQQQRDVEERCRQRALNPVSAFLGLLSSSCPEHTSGPVAPMCRCSNLEAIILSILRRQPGEDQEVLAFCGLS